MSEENQCSQCGVPLPVHTPQGLCPRCLLQWGLASQAEGGEAASQTAAGYAPPTPAELASYFPDLEILELVGRGGMGVVYKARQKRLDRLVALKILAPKIGRDPAFAERFAREARAMAMLSHPHVVAVHDFGQTPLARSGRGAGDEGPLYYFLMEFVDGVNLRRLLDTGKLAPEEALAIVPQVCDALQYAHDHGVVHRDIKPENVLLDKEGRVKIADFGIAKLVGTESGGERREERGEGEPRMSPLPPGEGQGEDSAGLPSPADGREAGFQGPASLPQLTVAGQIIGTPQYMAPEQIEHPLQVDHRADIYSLGVVFYQMLTGELPLGRFAPPSKKVQIDVRLDEVVLRALEKEPERRYQQASDLKTRVETIATSSRGRLDGEASGTALPRVFKTGNSRMTTPERLATFKGQFCHYRSTGHLVLDERQLTFSGDGMRLVIPLAAIRDLSIGHYPRIMNPAGLDLISVTYDEGGQSKRLFLGPYAGLLGLPSHFNQLVADWFHAIRDAATAATGRMPASTHAELLGVPSSSLGVVALVLVMVGIPLLPFLMFRLSGNAAGNAPLVWLPTLTAIGVVLFALLAVVFFIRAFARSKTGKSRVPSARGRPSGWYVAWLMVACVVLMGALSYLSHYYQQRSLDVLQRENAIQQRQIRQGQTQIEQRLRSLGLRWDSYGIELAPDRSRSIWHFVGLRELKVVNGTNASTSITGNLHVIVREDGNWQVSGDGQLGHVNFVMAAPSIEPSRSRPPGMSWTTLVPLAITVGCLVLAILGIIFPRRFGAGATANAFGIASETGKQACRSDSAPIAVDATIERARRQVKGPAIGLLVMGVFNLIAVAFVLLMAFYLSSTATPNDTLQPGGSIHISLFGVSGDFQRLTAGSIVFVVVASLFLLCNAGLMIFAALKMKRLEAYWLAVTASILAMITSPGNLIGLPIGIWALVVLSHRDVRAAFARNRDCATGSTGVSPPDDAQHYDTFPPSTGGPSGTPVAERSDGASRVPDDDAIEQAWLQVQGPAIGLLVLGILELLMILPFFALMIYLSNHADPRVADFLVPLALIVPGLAAALSSFTIVAALKMKRLEAYGLAVTASILALIASPSNLIGLAIGIWALVVLCRPTVGKAFEQRRQMKPAVPSATGFQQTIGTAALVLCVASFPLSLLGQMWFYVIALFLFLQLVALILGILGRRSFAGKTAVILSGIPLVVLSPSLVAGVAKVRHDFGGWPSMARVAPDAAAHYNLGLTFASRGRFDEAIAHYQEALEIQPNDADAHGSLGYALVCLGRFDEAMAHYRKALTIQPDNAEFQKNLAWLRATCPKASLRNGAAAIELAQRADHVCAGQRPDVLDTLAAAYAEAGWFPEARATARKALQIATQQNNRALADAVQARIALYEAGKPYRQTPRSIDVVENSGEPWIARLPSGVTVELLGVSENPSKDKPRWRPDGSPLAERPYDWLGASVGHEKAKIAREIVVRLRNVPSEAVGVSWQFDPPCDFATGNPSRLGSGMKDIRAVAIRVPGASRTVTVRFGVAAGPWKTVAEGRGRGGDVLGGDAVFSPAVAKDGNSIISVAHRFADQEVRVVADGLDGQERVGTPGPNGGGGKLFQMTATFSKALPKDIRKFRLQTRPYQWVEFRNVSLYPGQKTNVQVLVPAAPPSGSLTKPVGESYSPPRVPPQGFGSVTERVVNDWRESLVDSAVDLDSGKLFSMPKELLPKFGRGHFAAREIIGKGASLSRSSLVG